MDRTLTGECCCGTIRYRISAPLKAARSCHCSRCRKADPGVQISMHLFVGSKASWDHIGGSAPQHQGFP